MEVGVKGELADGHANGSIGIFEIKQDKVAQPDGAHRVPGTTTQAYYAARGATSGGIEGELSGRLAPGWSVTASASHFRAKDREQQDIDTLSPHSTARLFTTWTVRPGLTVGGPGHQPISTFARSNTPRCASAWEDSRPCERRGFGHGHTGHRCRRKD
jgi:outer membrane receptor for ferric coprogen and ferric-rhodotorulic acid